MLSRLRIRSKLLLAFGLILLPMGGLTLLRARTAWELRRDLILQSHDEMAEAAAAALHEFLHNFADTEQAMGIAAQRYLGSRDAFHRYIADVARATPHMLGCAVFTTEGQLLISDPAADWWQTLQDRSDICAVRSGLPWAVSNLQRAANGKLVILVTTPIPGNRGLLRVAVDATALKDLLTLPMRPGWRVVIVDRQGRLVYHSEDPQRYWEQRDWRQDVGVRQALTRGASRQESYRSLADGRPCLASYVRESATGWVVSSACPLSLATAPMKAAMALHNTLTALVVGLSLLLLLVLGAQISRPVERLAAAATSLGRGETSPVPETGQDELAVLARTFNQMARQIQERYEREHTIASTLQTAFLPREFPDCPGYQFGASYHPALSEAEVGGDFYDLFPLPQGRLGILLGDVSGKGLAAAIHATMTRYLARAYAFETSSPGQVLERLNRALGEWIADPELFVTAFYGVLDPRTDVFCYASAGHWPALLAGARGAEVIGGHGLVLGAVAEVQYEEGRLRLESGDALLLYSDGLVEVGEEDSIGQMERIQELLRRGRQELPQQLVERLYEDALWRGRGSLRDDLALLLLRCDKQPRRCRSAAHPAAAPEDLSGLRRPTP